MSVYGMRGCICTKPGGTAEAGLGFCPSRITETGAFFIPKNELGDTNIKQITQDELANIFLCLNSLAKF
jgi:hypothetical protein